MNEEDIHWCYVLGQTDNCTKDGGSTKELRRTVLIKELMGFAVTAYILLA